MDGSAPLPSLPSQLLTTTSSHHATPGLLSDLILPSPSCATSGVVGSVVTPGLGGSDSSSMTASAATSSRMSFAQAVSRNNSPPVPSLRPSPPLTAPAAMSRHATPFFPKRDNKELLIVGDAQYGRWKRFQRLNSFDTILKWDQYTGPLPEGAPMSMQEVRETWLNGRPSVSGWRHHLDRTGVSAARGALAERELELTFPSSSSPGSPSPPPLSSSGWRAHKVSGHIDCTHHIDYVMTQALGAQQRAWWPDQRALTLELKGCKGLSKPDAPQNYWMCLELHGTLKGKLGWLLGGKADVIAVHVFALTFVWLDRAKLAAWVQAQPQYRLPPTQQRDLALETRTPFVRPSKADTYEKVMYVPLSECYRVAGCGIITDLTSAEARHHILGVPSMID